MAHVVNIRNHTPTKHDVYIGRGTKWGNPYIIGKHGDRDTVIQKYRRHLYNCIQRGDITVNEILELDDKYLVCHCKPNHCHGDILIRAIQYYRIL